jgi:inorganic pyrophosphatase
MKGETERQMVQRHIREGEAIVQRQGAIVTTLQERGEPADIAITVLGQFHDILRQHKAHLARIDVG